MNRLLILLCMAGWALYIVHTNDRGDNLAAQNPKFSEHLSPAAQAPVDSIPSELQPIPATAVQSPHAITPDVMPRQVIANAPAPAPQMQPSESANSLPEASQDSAPQQASNQESEEQLRVTSETSIRSGPSDSAQLIGRAHAGATLRVKSREPGWVQFVDPVANETGWISMAYLGPADAVENTAPKNTKFKTKPMPKVAKLKTRKPLHNPVMRHIPPTYAQLPPDQEFVPPRRGGIFGLFWKRRLSDSPPPY
jgi:Bacterial SH3 domain